MALYRSLSIYIFGGFGTILGIYVNEEVEIQVTIELKTKI